MKKDRTILALCERCHALHVYVGGKPVALILSRDYGTQLLELAGRLHETAPTDADQLQRLAVEIIERRGE